MGEQYGRPLKVVPSQRALDVKIDQNMEDFILAREVSVFSNTKKFPFLFVESALNAFFGVVDTNVAGMIKSYSIEDKFGYITRLDGEGDVYVTEVSYIFNFLTFANYLERD